MFHLAAWTASVGAAAVDADLLLANDQMLPSDSAGNAILPWDAEIMAAYVLGTTLTRAKIRAPSLRRITYPFIRPFDLAVNTPDLPAVCIYDEGYRPKVVKNEALNIETTNAAGGAERHQGFLWLQTRNDPAPPGLVSTVRFTTAVVGVANTWSSGVMTPTETLPPGRYAVVGMNVVGATVLACRLIPTDGGIRPGCLAVGTVGLDDKSLWRTGKFGKFLEFEQTSPPQAEFYMQAASATQEVYLDLVKMM